MKIQCPVCSMQIEITKEQIGHKGRCASCESKFIIPENPGDGFDILHRGKAPDKKRLVLKRGENVATPRHRAVRTGSSSGGFPTGWVLGAAACVAAVVGFLVLNGKGDRKTIAPKIPQTLEELAAYADANTLPSSPVIPAPPSEKPAQPPVIEPEIAMTEEQGENVPSPATPSGTPPPAEQPPSLTDAQKASALAFMKSNDPRKRKGAYAAIRKLEELEKEIYAQLLTEAREHYSEELGIRASTVLSSENALGAFAEDYAAWRNEQENAKTLVQTNWKDKEPDDYKKRHTEMDQAFGTAAKAYDRAMRSAKQAHEFQTPGLQEITGILGELDTELAWCNDETPPEPAMLRDALADSGAAKDYLETLDAISTAIGIAEAHDAANQHNAGSGWADAAYKSFAAILNERRVALGLTPLQLDEQLSDACRDHSEDMAVNNYFSHTGLTEETKGFGQRATRAGFSGFATGECIYMGSPAALAAHQAWWYSDGHRLIMYANNPNTLGLGLYGKYWTLNTGKK